MKKKILVALMILGLVAAAAFAGGGQVRGEIGYGETVMAHVDSNSFLH